MAESSTASTTDQFVGRLDDFGVSSTVIDPEAVETEIEAVAATPTVGVDPGIEGVSLPSSVDRDISPATVEAAATGVTGAVLGVADYGSIVIPTTRSGVEPVALFADQHVAVIQESAIVPDMGAALSALGDRFRDDDWSGIIATGPSATADMGALVTGAHGPKTVHVLVVRS